MSLNVVVLIGNLTRDVEVKTTASGKSVANASIAVNGRPYKRGDEYVTDVAYVDVEAWDTGAVKLGEAKKGEKLMVKGSLKQQTWENQEGKKMSKLIIRADEFERLGSFKKNTDEVKNNSQEDVSVF